MPEPSSRSQTSLIRPAELLRRLLRYDTTNPPGNEGECIGYIAGLLADAGLKPTLLAKDPERPNLIARLEGWGKAAPLLLYGHVDVATTTGQSWTHPPFAGKVADGFVWGRGALDMKGGVAMMLAALLRAKAEGLRPAGDIVLAVLSDEEAGGGHGAEYLVEAHAGRFAGVRYAIGEFGGFSFYLGGRRFYPVQVAEKRICWLKATVRGPGGHGALPMRGGTMARLARVLRTLDRWRLPVHVTPVAKGMIETIAASLPLPTGLVLRQLLNPALTDRTLALLGDKGRSFDPLLHNTVNVTVVRGGDTREPNVIPSEVFLGLDGRLLPGYGPDDLMAELRGLTGKEVALELVRHDPGPAEPEMGLFKTLAGILRELDGEGVPVPLLLPGVTDGRTFSRLGIQTYGFLPMNLPEGFNFTETIHAADERIPVEAVAFGTEAIYRVLQRYGG